MTHPWLLLALTLGMAGLRVSGLALGDLRIPASWERAWRFVPVALLSALIIVSLAGRETSEASIRGLALIGAGIVTFRVRQLWVCIVSGMIFYFSFRWLV
ncbi:hypothetical protein BH23CHL2_BH23CHL2_28060 [soil metagenome]